MGLAIGTTVMALIMDAGPGTTELGSTDRESVGILDFRLFRLSLGASCVPDIKDR